MNKKIYYSALFFFLAINAFPVFAQSGARCGTYVDAAQIAKENLFTITDTIPTQSLPQVNRTLSITVFVVKDQSGSAGIDSTSIYNAISTLNQYFSPIALSFRICSAIHYINNYNFNNLHPENDINNPLNAKDLVTLNFEPNTINLYLVTNLYNPNDVDGYTYMPGTPGKNFIFLSKISIGGSTLAHQMGHFFNLYHTHETNFGAENVARSGLNVNCTTAGDRCCDTEADPNLDGKVSSACVYNKLDKDSKGAFYNPSPKNLMSFSLDNCRCAFSRTQFIRMKYALEHFRTNLR